MSNKPTAYRLSIYISGAIIVVFVAFIYWVYNYNRAIMRDNIHKQAISLGTEIIGNVREKVISVQEVTSNVALQVPFYHQHHSLDQLVSGVVQKYVYLEALQIEIFPPDGSTDTIVYSYSRRPGGDLLPEAVGGKKICSEELKAVSFLHESGKSGWSEPFYCQRDDRLAVSFYYPFQLVDPVSKKKISGGVTSELSLLFLNDLIGKTKIGERGFAFLVSPEGTYITHPVTERILHSNIYRFSESVYKGDPGDIRRAFESGTTGTFTAYPPTLGYAKSWVYHTSVPENRWMLVFVVPYAELYAGPNWLLVKMSVVALFLVSAIFLLVFYISTRLMKPLSKLTNEIHSFSGGAGEFKTDTRNEAEALSKSLLRLQSMYESFRLKESESKMLRARFRHELQTASEIQQSIIPPAGKFSIEEAGISIYSLFKPANFVSGDLYDFFRINDETLLITIGDVSGAGVPAALFMSVAHTFIKSTAAGKNAREIVTHVNKELCNHNANQFFLTLFLGIINLKDGNLNYCNAGHTPSFLLHESGHIRELADPHGLPLGLYSERTYKDSHIQLVAGDKLVLYTDGVTELADSSGTYFGTERLRQVLHLARKQTPEEIASQIEAGLDSFRGEARPGDDISIVVLQYK